MATDFSAQRLATSSPLGDIPLRGTGRRLEGRDLPTKRTKPKATKKADLAVRIQPRCPEPVEGSACTLGWAELYHLLYINAAGKLTLAVIFKIRPNDIHRQVRLLANVDIELIR
jgi:hypothetical protein